MSHGKTIAKNAAWLMLATTIQKAVSFLSFTYVASLLGANITGRYFFVVSITSIFVTLTDLGMTPVVIRELAQDPERGKAAAARAITAKLVLIPIAITAAVLYGFVVGIDQELFLALLVACGVMSADALSLLWYGVLRGQRQLRFEAMGMMVGQFLSAIVAVATAIVYGSVAGLVVALLAGSAWNLFWSRWQVGRLKLAPGAENSWTWTMLAKAALPFALAGIFVKVYSYVDSLLLRQFFDETAVGYYAAAYKVTYAFQFLPLTFVAALYPGMSAAYASREKKTLQELLQGSLRIMLIASVILSAGLSAYAPLIIKRMFGADFLPAISPMSILPWVLIPIFLDFPIGSLLNATHRAMTKTKAMGFTMLVNIAANFIFVPMYGPSGAAIAGLISFWFLFFCGVWYVRNDIVDWKASAWLFFKGLVVAALLWYSIHIITADMQIIFAILFGGAMSLVLLFASKLLLFTDVLHIMRWIKGKTAGSEEQVQG